MLLSVMDEGDILVAAERVSRMLVPWAAWFVLGVCLFFVAVVVSLVQRGGRLNRFWAGLVASCSALSVLCGVFSLHFFVPISVPIWVILLLFVTIFALVLFWRLVDPLFQYVEGPALLLLIGFASSLGSLLAASQLFHSQVFTSSSIVTTLLGRFGFIYIKRILEQRQAIREMLLPFLSATVRLKTALSLVSAGVGKKPYYSEKAKKGVACVLYEIFTYFGAMEVKRSKVQHNTKLFGKLHGLCLGVRKAAGGTKSTEDNLDFSVQEFGIVLAANMRASDFQEVLESAAEGASGTGSGLAVASPSAPALGFALSMPLTDRQAFLGLKETILDWSRKLENGDEIEQVVDMIAELDKILDTFGFDVELDVEAT